MEEAVQEFFAKGLADSTKRTYKAGKERYLKFCEQTGAAPLPVVNSVLCAFVAYLALEGLKHGSIKVYLSAVRHMQITEGMPDPFEGSRPRLEYVLRGIKRDQAEKGQASRTRLPVTPSILRKLRRVWTDDGWDTRMVWAACCLCYFGFLRISEMTAPSDGGYSASDHLSMGDIAFDCKRNPALLRVSIKKSKTDPFRKGVSLYLGRTAAELCPVASMVKYLEKRGTAPGPLFKFEDGRTLTRTRFVEWVRKGLVKVGVDSSKYCSHSFRIGAATAAAKAGIDDSVIKTLGRWESVAYLQYVKIPRSQLASYTERLSRV